MGTIEYMSPEQVKGDPLDGSADQFSLAAVAYLMVSGTTLFGQHSFATLAYKIVNEQPPPARTHNSALPPAIDAVLLKGLGKSPSDRFPSCSQFVEALAAAFSDTMPPSEEATRVVPVVIASKEVTPPATPVIAPKEVARPTPMVIAPRKFPAGIAAVLGILILAGAAWFVWKRPTSQPADAVVQRTDSAAQPADKKSAASTAPWK